MAKPPSVFCIDPYVVDTLMHDLVGHDRRPSAFIVYLYFVRQCGSMPAGSTRASLAQIVEGTGLSRRAVQDAIALLRRRKLLANRGPIRVGASARSDTHDQHPQSR